MADGSTHEALLSLASLGNHGRQTANQERDLHRWLKNLWGLELETYGLWLELYATLLRSDLFCLLPAIFLWMLCLLFSLSSPGGFSMGFGIVEAPGFGVSDLPPICGPRRCV